MICDKMTLKRQKVVFSVLIVLGIVGLVVATLVSLPDYARGFLYGLGTSLTVVGCIMLIRLLLLSRNPERAREYEEQARDERAQYINGKAMSLVMLLSAMGEFAVAVACISMGLRDVGVILCSILICQGLLLQLARAWYDKKY